MYTEDKIFGPLTFKQFLCVAVAIGLYYFFESQIPDEYRLIVIIALIIAALAGILRFQPKKIANMEEYFSVKKSELAPSEYQKMLQVKLATLQSEIHMRKEKGVNDDPKLLKAAEMLEKLIGESKGM